MKVTRRGWIMDTDTAFELVLELAQQNVIDAHDDLDEAKRQQEAIDVVTDFYVNNIADGY